MAAAPVDDEGVELFESGSGHIVGALTADGRPFAMRAWGVRFGDGRDRARVLLAATEVTRLGRAPDGLAGVTLAVTATDVRTLQARQFKGPVDRIEAPTAADLICFERYCHDFIDAVQAVDGFAPSLMARLVPDEVVACEMHIVEVYDQTPGPGAGRPVGRS